MSEFGQPEGMSRVSEPKLQGKAYDIPKRLVVDAWLKVKRNGGAGGADGVTIEQFEANLKGNLYKLWNRMSSGSYLLTAALGEDDGVTVGSPQRDGRSWACATSGCAGSWLGPVKGRMMCPPWCAS